MTDDDMLNRCRATAALRTIFRSSAACASGMQSAHRRQAQGRARAVPRREVHAQLHALLAAQDADHLSRDYAMVRRNGRRAGFHGTKPAEPLRATALRGIDATQFFPEWGKARLHGMIANRPDWTLSRQRQ
jgi:hypothetical protein